MTFNSLPPEILGMVCGFSDFSGLKALRSTNRILAAVIPCKKIFNEVVLYMNQASLECIQNVARDKHMAPAVRRLWIQGDYPEEIKNLEDFKSLAREHRKIDVVNPEFKRLVIEMDVLLEEKKWLGSEEYERRLDILIRRVKAVCASTAVKKISQSRLRGHLRQYKKLQKEAIQMQTNCSIRDALRLLFQSCPNLDSVDYTMEHIIRTTTTSRNKQFAEGLIAPWGQPLMHERGVNGVEQVVLAATDTGFSPRELSLGGVSNSVLEFPNIIDLLPLFAKNIEILEWDFALPRSPVTDELSEEETSITADNFRIGCFYRFIKHASMLREFTITLDFDGSMESFYTPFTISNLLGDMTFYHLTKFHVDTMWAEFDELSGFFLRHAETLNDVFLTQWTLESGLWRELFEAIVGKLKNLKHFELRGEFEDSQSTQCFGHIGWFTQPTKRGKAISSYVRGEISDYPEEESEEKDYEKPHTPYGTYRGGPYDEDDEEVGDIIQDTELYDPFNPEGDEGDGDVIQDTALYNPFNP